MSPPVPRINTFLENTNKPIIEPISKFFVIASSILGVNRLPLLGSVNIYCFVFMFIYTTLLNVLFAYVSIVLIPDSLVWSSQCIMDMFQYFICSALGFFLHKRLQNFYLTLNKFDEEIGTNKAKFGVRESLYNILQLFTTLVLSISSYFFDSTVTFHNYLLLFQVLPIKISNCLELHYYGHLISLTIPRLEALNDYLKKSYPNEKNKNQLTNSPDSELQSDQKSYLEMKKLMDCYNNIIIVYDCLNEAIKWQMLSLLISTFYLTLAMMYFTVKSVISEGTANENFSLVSLALMVILLFPVLVPCVFADRVQKKVYLIKDYLATKLYENTLDKSSRSTARTLLALIETRNLTFSVFHMFDIDISLPFKLMALLLTYLIILLQFDKVISPSKST